MGLWIEYGFGFMLSSRARRLTHNKVLWTFLARVRILMLRIQLGVCSAMSTLKRGLGKVNKATTTKVRTFVASSGHGLGLPNSPGITLPGRP